MVKLRILRTMFIPAALRGGEASSVSERSVCRLRSAFVRDAWSGHLPFANPGVVFSFAGWAAGVPSCLSCCLRMRRRFLPHFLVFLILLGSTGRLERW